MRLVIVESPFAGDVELNLRYLRAAMRDCLLRGEAPFASHALYTQAGVLDDLLPDERALGIGAGLAWGAKAEATVVYTDLGLSAGMRHGIAAADAQRRPIEKRTIPGWEPAIEHLLGLAAKLIRSVEAYDSVGESDSKADYDRFGPVRRACNVFDSHLHRFKQAQRVWERSDRAAGAYNRPEEVR